MRRYRMKKSFAEGILFTDQYQLTMAQLYFHLGLHKNKVQFDYFFRNYPNYGAHQAGYCINAGLRWLLDWIRVSRFRPEELALLRNQKTQSGKPFYSSKFLNWLKKEGNFSEISINAIPEGRVIHVFEPLAVIQGPLAMAQILESPLLNYLNYQTLIATKASRIKESGCSKLLLEFGLRRGQGLGANAGARAALIGGADFSSNVGISHLLGLPPKGTHGHSMVQLFIALGGGELNAFKSFAELYPDDCILLVDTINTLESGIPNAIKVFEMLKKKGHTPLGIRLDSGDLAYLCIQSAKMLNEAGFPDVKIVLSNQLDELVIMQIVTQIRNEAANDGVDPDHLINRLIYGVGTNLITSKGFSALDGVYKLVAVKKDRQWIPSLKISESKEKVTNPGHKNIWRIYDKRNKAIADLIGLSDENIENDHKIILRHPLEASKTRLLTKDEISSIEKLLIPVFLHGRNLIDEESIHVMRKRRDEDLENLDEGVKRLVNPHIYHVSITEKLWDLKHKLLTLQKSSYQKG